MRPSCRRWFTTLGNSVKLLVQGERNINLHASTAGHKEHANSSNLVPPASDPSRPPSTGYPSILPQGQQACYNTFALSPLQNKLAPSTLLQTCRTRCYPSLLILTYNFIPNLVHQRNSEHSSMHTTQNNFKQTFRVNVGAMNPQRKLLMVVIVKMMIKESIWNKHLILPQVNI